MHAHHAEVTEHHPCDRCRQLPAWPPGYLLCHKIHISRHPDVPHCLHCFSRQPKDASACCLRQLQCLECYQQVAAAADVL
jgi:hypothetical protein